MAPTNPTFLPLPIFVNQGGGSIDNPFIEYVTTGVLTLLLVSATYFVLTFLLPVAWYSLRDIFSPRRDILDDVFTIFWSLGGTFFIACCWVWLFPLILGCFVV